MFYLPTSTVFHLFVLSKCQPISISMLYDVCEHRHENIGHVAFLLCNSTVALTCLEGSAAGKGEYPQLADAGRSHLTTASIYLLHRLHRPHRPEYRPRSPPAVNCVAYTGRSCRSGLLPQSIRSPETLVFAPDASSGITPTASAAPALCRQTDRSGGFIAANDRADGQAGRMAGRSHKCRI